MSNQRRIRAKVCLVGDCGVGKTSLIRRLLHDEFNERYVPTPSTEVSKVEYRFLANPDSEVVLEMDIWDITGQKAFRKFLSDSYFYNSRSIVAVCDATRKSTLEEIEEWVDAGRRIAGDIPTHTLANKMDLEDRVVLNDVLIKKICNKLNSSVFFVSAKTGANVDLVFQMIAEKVLENAMAELEENEKILRQQWEILSATAQRGRFGASKEFFFTTMKGIGFDTLKFHVEELEKKGYLKVVWNDPTNFVAYATEAGIERAEL
ncbi:MAG: Rab family GTPase, partial [Thermoplasmata archaeon]